MPAAAPEAGDGAKPRKLSVLQMANNFAQHAEQSSSPAPPAAPTIKWLSTDKVLKLNGNTVTKSSPASPPPAEEYGVAVANVMLSSGVHGTAPLVACDTMSPCQHDAQHSAGVTSWSARTGWCASVNLQLNRWDTVH
jgi:hypothetical protein